MLASHDNGVGFQQLARLDHALGGGFVLLVLRAIEVGLVGGGAGVGLEEADLGGVVFDRDGVQDEEGGG